MDGMACGFHAFWDLEDYVEHWNRKRNLPPEPTQHLPGTEEKRVVMEWRLENGYHLHHPDDAKPPEKSLDVQESCLGRRAGTRKLRIPKGGE